MREVLGNPSPSPRDFPRPERFPEGEARGKSRGSRKISRAEGMDFPIPPEFWWSTDILLIINPSTGMDQEIHPCGQGRIDSVKINPSLLSAEDERMVCLSSKLLATRGDWDYLIPLQLSRPNSKTQIQGASKMKCISEITLFFVKWRSVIGDCNQILT